MTTASKTLLDNVLALSRKERAELVAEVLASLEEDKATELDEATMEAACAEESARRMQAWREGKIGSVPGEQVFKEIEERYRTRSESQAAGEDADEAKQYFAVSDTLCRARRRDTGQQLTTDH